MTLEPARPDPAGSRRVPEGGQAGNELGGLRAVQLPVPLATYAPWSLRWGYAAATDELVDFLGTYIPFPTREAERRAVGDPRPSLEALYGEKPRYLAAARAAADALAGRGLLLDEDVARVLANAARQWDWVTGN